MVKLLSNFGILALVTVTALVGSCGDDDDGGGPDGGGGNGIDAASSTSVDAATAQTFGFSLLKTAEIPPCANAGASAGGTASVTVSADNTMITVSANYSNLSSAANMAHIHFGNDTVASGQIVLNFGTPSTPLNKTFTSADYVAATGAPANFAAFVTALKAGNAYINVHTSMCPAGEIRGQIR